MAESLDKPVVMVVDDEQPNLDVFGRMFRHEFNMTFAISGAQALELMKSQYFDVAIVDYKMPQMNGVEFIRKAMEIQPDMFRIMLTAHVDLPEVISANSSGLLAALLAKPWERNDVLKWVNHYSRLARGRRLSRGK